MFQEWLLSQWVMVLLVLVCGWLLGFNLFFMAKGDNSSLHLLCCSSSRNQARFSTRKKKKKLAWPLFCLFFHLPPTGAWLVGSTLPTMKGELPQWGLSYILSPSAAEKPLLEVKWYSRTSVSNGTRPAGRETGSFVSALASPLGRQVQLGSWKAFSHCGAPTLWLGLNSCECD